MLGQLDSERRSRCRNIAVTAGTLEHATYVDRTTPPGLVMPLWIAGADDSTITCASDGREIESQQILAHGTVDRRN
jgi:hypothetical protein